MNERIKELMLEAGYAAPHLAGRAHKLVDLIVRECIDVCTNGWQGEFTAAGISQCVDDLKEHFGVE